MGERLTNAELADRLGISGRTVESHVSCLLRKLGASDRHQLGAFVPMGAESTNQGAGDAEGLVLPLSRLVERGGCAFSTATPGSSSPLQRSMMSSA
jgi:hypothetical protein